MNTNYDKEYLIETMREVMSVMQFHAEIIVHYKLKETERIAHANKICGLIDTARLITNLIEENAEKDEPE